MEIDSNLSILFAETEKPGQIFPEETQIIIRDRYEFAGLIVKNKVTLEIGSGSGLGINFLSSVTKSLNCLEYDKKNFEYLISNFFS